MLLQLLVLGVSLWKLEYNLRVPLFCINSDEGSSGARL